LWWTGSHWRIDPSRDDALTTGFVGSLAKLIAEEAHTLTTLALSSPPGREQKDLLERIFRPHFAARRTISEGYLPSCALT